MSMYDVNGAAADGRVLRGDDGAADVDAGPSLIVVGGPTAVGKSSLALELAERLGGELVSCDSVQVYRGLDIGSAKPTSEEQARVRHHLIDLLDPREIYSAARFAEDADAAIVDITARGRVPIVVGGTGLYLRALLYGLSAAPGRDDAVRARWEAVGDRDGAAALHAALALVDPSSAERLHPNDRVRVVRALEVFELTGRPLSEQQQEHGFRERRYRFAALALTLERAALDRLIDERVVAMVEAGLIDEVRGLLEAGVPPDAPALAAIGYRQTVAWLESGAPVAELVDQVARDTRAFARRQMVWFRKEPGVRWLDAATLRGERAGVVDELERALRGFLGGGGFAIGASCEADARAGTC